MFNTVTKWVDSVVDIILATSLAVISCVTFCEVVSRYFLHFSIPWAMDVVRMAFIYCVLFGAVAGVRNKAHLNIDVLLVLLPENLRRWADIFIDIAMGFFFVVLVVFGNSFVRSAGTQVMPYTLVPMRYLYAGVPVAGLLMLYYLVQQLKGKLTSSNRG
ncbi:MAG: TRAP transporter small permease [bacterium]|jgi:TRAP-type C4-dicarboxylate transport system permease small subunit